MDTEAMRPAEPKDAGQARPARPGLVLAACCLSQLVVVLDGSIMNVALPAVQSDLSFDQNSLQWVLNAFMIPFAGLLLLAGRMADLFGRRRLFLTGIAVFTVSSLLGGLAVSSLWLILARAGQGVGAAIIAPATLSVLSTTFVEPKERAKAFGLWGAAAGSGGAIGVLAGGVIVEWLSWRWVLLVNIPLGAVLMFMVASAVAESRDPQARRRLDVMGALSVTLGLALIVYGIAEGERYGWGSTRILTALGAGVLLLVFFLVDQAKLAEQPIMPLSIFRSRSVSVANAVTFFGGAAMLSTFYFITMQLQLVLGYSALHTGLAYLPLSLATFVGAGGCSVVVARTGSRPVLLVGLVLAAVGLLWLSRADETAAFAADLLGPTVIFGIGLGLLITGTANAATADVPESQQGLASGLLNTNQTLGSAVGLAILVAVANSRTKEAMKSVDPADAVARAHALSSGYERAFLVTAGVLAATVLIALAAPKARR
ncbi:MFS transporter [Streptomyces sp. NPDC058274]|uniref:MFS transporter n=1 Tax=Streptomyces sp. NPDC058274 TaxID=3346416 RepID=UPI0036E98215